jgi:hypothetical protein
MSDNIIISDLINEIVDKVVDIVLDEIDYKNDLSELNQARTEELIEEQLYQDKMDEETRVYWDSVYNENEWDGCDECGNYIGFNQTDVFDISSNGTCDF